MYLQNRSNTFGRRRLKLQDYKDRGGRRITRNNKVCKKIKC